MAKSLQVFFLISLVISLSLKVKEHMELMILSLKIKHASHHPVVIDANKKDKSFFINSFMALKCSTLVLGYSFVYTISLFMIDI